MKFRQADAAAVAGLRQVGLNPTMNDYIACDLQKIQPLAVIRLEGKGHKWMGKRGGEYDTDRSLHTSLSLASVEKDATREPSF